LNAEYQNLIKKPIINFQAPLSGEAEERVAGVASPGESSPPCDIRHSPSKFRKNLRLCLLASGQATFYQHFANALLKIK
jgi:hypothetical protein